MPSEWENICVEKGVATVAGVQCLIANLLSIAMTGIGLVGFVMIIIAAYRFLVSGGSSGGTETARKTLTFAVIGIVVALSAFIVLNLIADFTGVKTILNFVIPSPGTDFN